MHIFQNRGSWIFQRICGGSKKFRNQKILSFPYSIYPRANIPKGAKFFVKKWMFHTTLPLTSTSLTISSTYSWQKRSLRWTSLKRKIMEVIEEDQLEHTNNERLSWAKPHSGQKPKNENDLWQKTTLDGRRPLTEDNLWQKTTFDRRWPLTEDDIRRKMTLDRRWPLTEDDL